MKSIIKLLAVFIALAGSLSISAQNGVQPYFTTEQLPDLIKCLPAPPDTVGEAFVHDIMRYM